MRRIFFLISLGFIALTSCKSGSRKSSDQDKEGSLKQFEIVEAWRTDTVLMTPESVILDKKRDILYVSNMNLEARKKDGNGFISRLGKDGKILDLHWIDGLSSPKGLAIAGDTLYATDVDEIVVMDINKGEIARKIPITGAKMLNDITSDDEGNLYFADTDASKIHIYAKGKTSEWLSEGLNGPNGLLADGERLLVASQGSMDFTAIDIRTKSRTLITEGINRGDGIAFTGIPRYYIVTDWSGEIFMINPDNTKFSLLNTKEQKTNAADIEFIPEISLLLVPTFSKNCIVAYKLAEK